MDNKKTEQQLASYLLLNAYSLKNIGLYNGKAGISLCLFETAKYLQDESIEEHAFELLQESMVLGEKKNDLTFESGLSGIGFVLLYLIEKRFIDADFKELFGEYKTIILTAINEENAPLDKMFSYIRFLAPLYKLNQKQEVNDCIAKIRNAKEKQLLQQINESKLSKFEFLNDFVYYLQIAADNQCPISDVLIEQYAGLYQKDKFVSRFEIAFYLERLIPEQKRSGLITETIRANEIRALENIKIHPEQFPLAAQIDLLYLFRQNPTKYKPYIVLLEKDLLVSEPKDLQKNLLKEIPRSKFIPGYESGIARFLLYLVYRNVEEQRLSLRT